jgi:hypothetical protein
LTVNGIIFGVRLDIIVDFRNIVCGERIKTPLCETL